MILSVLLLFANSSRKSSGNIEKNQSDSNISQLTGSENYPVNINFRSFQNADSTWGFTVFVNTKPYLHHKRIPLNKANSGFKSKNDAEKVARLFTRMIRKGDMNPALNKYSLDSLDISMN